MNEQIYCPKCEGSEHKTDYSALQRSAHWSISWFKSLRNITLRFSLFYKSQRNRPSAFEEDTKEESYVPEGFCCQNCGHHFLSAYTYEKEIEWAHKYKKSGWISGFLHLLLTVLLLADFYVHPPIEDLDNRNIIILIVAAFCAISSFVGFCCGVASSRIIKNMTAEWKEFSKIQAKHLKTPTPKEQIPTWKRVQMENT